MNNLQGILLVIAGMLGFAIGDVFVKQLTTTLPNGQIIATIGLFSGIIFAALAIRKGENLFAARIWRPIMLIRTAVDGAAAVFFTSALARVDLSTVAAVFQTLPLVITLGAALFLGEKVGWRRWSAIGVGFCGVLMIIRPGFSGFDPNTFLVLGAVVAIATRDLITQRIDAAISSNVVSFQGFFALFVAGTLLQLASGAPLTTVSAFDALLFAGAVAFVAAAYWAVVAAMRVGEASVVAPYRYTRLLFSVTGGMLAFGERPDLLTLLGAALIFGSGLYTFLRERQLTDTSDNA